MNNPTGKVMVLGGGIAGLTAAWELSKQNVRVELVEKSCFLGGHAIGFTCKATEQCQQCGACSVEEMLANVVAEPLINIHLRSEVAGLEKKGGFKASIVKSVAAADAAKGKVLQGFSRHNSPLYVVGEDVTEEVPQGAVAINELGYEGDIDVDAVVVATGFTPFDAALKSTYGYGVRENVVTGLELENLLRENQGAARPSDGKAPGKIAFIQCVGSRDERLGHLWCSEVCCAYAMRMAGVIKHKAPETEITIFYIDIQNTGKEFPVFYEKIKEDVRFVRTIPVDIYPVDDGGLRVRHMVEEAGEASMEDFDMVVLSVGIMPGADSKAISDTFGVPLNQDGFLDNAAVSAESGIFVAGTASGPGSIAATITDSGKAAHGAMKYLGVTK